MPTKVFCDTQAIVCCGLAPERLSPAAAKRMQMGWEQNRAPLVTSDTKLRAIPELETIW